MLINNDFEVIVCGGGPAGLMAAFTAAESGKRVAILERLNRVGKKLSATGGGRCNLTNKTQLTKFIQAFNEKETFVKPSLKTFSPELLIAFFENHGLKMHSPTGPQVYPVTEKAMDVVSCLQKIAQEKGVVTFTESNVDSLVICNQQITGVITGELQYNAQSVIVAAGGMSHSELGSNGSGYSLAQSAGHAIVKPVPALAGLRSDESWPSRCSGLSIDPAIIYLEDPKYRVYKKRGAVLFTHKGISGPAALNISKYVSQFLQNESRVKIRIRPLPDSTREELAAFLIRAQQKMGTTRLRILLSDRLPSRLVNQIMILAGIDLEIRAADVKKESKNRLLELLDTGFVLSVNATDDFSSAMVTSGGICIDEIDSHSMQSKNVKGLYFCGEVIDVDGPCGGYNLQWAFSSGYMAGMAAAKF
jgi:predicted Rossmann fold flavoprotein